MAMVYQGQNLQDVHSFITILKNQEALPTILPAPSSLLYLHKRDWGHILVSSARKVISESQNRDQDENDDGPVEVRHSRRVTGQDVRRPEGEEERHDQEDEGDVVDETTVFAEGPAAGE